MERLSLADYIQSGILLVLITQGFLLFLTFRNAAKAARTQAHNAALQIRPAIKGEWERWVEGPGVEFRLTNVGLGAAIIDRIEVRWTGGCVGEYSSSDDRECGNYWRSAITAAAKPLHPRIAQIDPMPLTDLNRALAPREHQAIVRVTGLEAADIGRLQRKLSGTVWPIVHFRSMNGQRISSIEQYNKLDEPA